MAISTTWDTSYEASPAGGDSPTSGDDEMRSTKLAIRERAELEHIWGTGEASAGHGWHREGSAKAYFQDAAPTNRPDNATSLTSDDAGRLWFDDNDSDRFYFYTGSTWTSALAIASLTTSGNVTVGGDVSISGRFTPTAIEATSSYYTTSSISQNTIFDQLSPEIPTTNDTIRLTGSWIGPTGDIRIPSHAKRTSSTTIDIYGCRLYVGLGGSPITAAAFTDTVTDGSATGWAADVALAW